MKPTRNVLIASLGSSPGVLSETAWHLCVTDALHLDQIEVWTTASGRDNLLKELNDNLLWGRLRAAMPSDADRARLPDLTDAQIHVFQDAQGAKLDDIRSADDSQQLLQQLCERVRALTAAGDVRLLGSMAGGRKTMSAALQTAFELYAGRHDRLLHVLLHHKLEGDRAIFTHFRFPEHRWQEQSGVPMAEQISITEIPFPRLRPLLDLEDLGESRTYDELMAHINTRLALQGDDLRSSWRFQAGRGQAAGVYTLTLQAADQAPIALRFSPEQVFLLRALQERPTQAAGALAVAYEDFKGRACTAEEADPNFRKAYGRINKVFRDKLSNHQEFNIIRPRKNPNRPDAGTVSWPGGRRLAPVPDPAQHDASR